MMRATFLLLIPCMLIDIVIGELIEIKIPTDTRLPNASQTLDKAILRNDMNSADYTSVLKKYSNLSIVPWPMSRITRDEKHLLNYEDSPSLRNLVSFPLPRTSKSGHISTNYSSKVPAGRQVIPVEQLAYPSGKEMSVKPNQTLMGIKKSKNKGIYGIYGTETTDVGETYFRHRNERRKNDEIVRKYDENTHGSDEDYTSPDKYFSSSNYEPENANAHTANYASPSGQYGSENYDSYYTKNFGDYRNHQSSAEYFRSGDPWSARRPRPNSGGYSRFTVESSNDYRAHGEAPASLTSIFFAIGSNLLQLFKIGLGSGLSIAIPIIALKIFLIPLKILTFMKIIKIILKLIFVVPFVLRVFGPSIYSAIGYHGAGFSNKMGGMPTHESRDILDQAGKNYTWLNSLATNLASALPDTLSPKNCPSRVACELGSYLASRSNIPEKMTIFLANDDLEEDENFHEKHNEKEEVTTVFVKALTQRWAYNQCDVFACGISI